MAINVPIVTTFDARGISKAIKDFQKLEGAALKTGFVMTTLDTAATKLATGLAKVGTALGAVGGLAVKNFMDFDQAMNESLAIMGNVTEEMRTNMSNAAREMAKNSLFSAQEAAQAYFFLASAGLDASQSIQALPVVTRFAQAGMFDLEVATSLLADAQSALGLKSSDAAVNMENMARVADVLVQGNIMANASVEQLSAALTNKAAAAMRSVGMTVEEGVAVLSAFADQGVKGEEAGTRFAIVLRELQRRALENNKVFQQYGITVFDSAGELQAMSGIIGDVEDALEGKSDAEKKAILTMLGFNDESQTVLLGLIGTSEQIKRYEDGLRAAGGVTQTVADRQIQSLSGQLTIAKNKVQDVAISLGGALAPTVSAVADAVGVFAQLVGERGLGEAFAYLAGKVINAISGLGTFGKIILGLVGAFAALKVATTVYTSVLAIGKVAVDTFGISLRTVSGIALGFAGAVTAIIGVAATVYGIYAARKATAVDQTIAFAEALKLEGEAQQQALADLYLADEGFKRGADTLLQFGFNLRDVDEFVRQGTGNIAGLVDEIASWADWSSFSLDKIEESGPAMSAQRVAIENLRMAFPQLRRASDEQVIGFMKLMVITRQLRTDQIAMDKALGVVTQGFEDATAATDAFDEALAGLDLDGILGLLDDTGKSAGGAGGAVKSAQERLEDYIQSLRTWDSQNRAIEQAIKQVTNAQERQRTATEKVAEAQQHFNNVTQGYAADSKEAIEAAERLADAQDRLESANRRVGDAQERLADAQQRLNDLYEPASARSVQEATDEVTMAQYRLADAQKELEKLQRRAQPNERAIAEAQIAVRDATNQLADAEAALIDLRDGPTAAEVADANEAIADAQRDVVDAQKAQVDATKAVTEAQAAQNEILNGAVAGSDAYTEAVDKLTEAKRNEREAIDAVAEAIRNERDARYELADAEKAVSASRGEIKKRNLPAADLEAFNRYGIISPALRAELDKIDWSAFAQMASLPGRADGGPVQAGRSYIVGVRGPELFTASNSGMITPNGDLGNTVININVAGSVVSERQLVESVRVGLLRTQKSGRAVVL